jgi:DNA-binding protein H-NS
LAYEDLKQRDPPIVPEHKIGFELGAMSVDELWTLREKVGDVLSKKIAIELNELKKRLALLNPEPELRSQHKTQKDAGSGRRRYPIVLPKYQNPELPSETWAGRGRQPRWFKTQLSLGARLEDLVIR